MGDRWDVGGHGGRRERTLTGRTASLQTIHRRPICRNQSICIPTAYHEGIRGLSNSPMYSVGCSTHCFPPPSDLPTPTQARNTRQPMNAEKRATGITHNGKLSTEHQHMDRIGNRSPYPEEEETFVEAVSIAFFALLLFYSGYQPPYLSSSGGDM